MLTTAVKIYWALLSGKSWAKHFTSVISLNPHNKENLVAKSRLDSQRCQALDGTKGL